MLMEFSTRKFVALAALAVSFQFVSQAQNNVTLNDMTFTLNENTKECKLTKIDATAKTANIPSTVANEGVDYTVTEIASYAAENCDALATLTIPGSVKAIGRNSFAGCTSLTDLNLPEGLVSINSYAFNDCSSMKSISIPTTLTTLETSVFYGCSSLEKVEISDLTSWMNISFPDQSSNPTSLAKHLYTDNQEITKIVVPKGVTEIKPFAFSGLTSVTEVTVSADVKKIGKNAFMGCTGIEAVNTPDLAAWCDIDFELSSANPVNTCHVLLVNGKQLSEVVVPDGATTVKKYVFSGCTSISKITFPESLKSLGDYAFYNCTGLQDIDLPATVTSIGKSAFQACSGLKSIVIPESITTLNNNTFYNCTALETVTFSGNITSIGQATFRNCEKLISIVLPEKCTTVNRQAFMGCTGLTSITFPASMTTIDNNAFGQCDNISSVICKATVPPTLDRNAFTAIYETATLNVPEGSKSAYSEADIWSQFTNITEGDSSGIDDIEADGDAGIMEVYSLTGNLVAKCSEMPSDLHPGLYIVKQGKKVSKIIVR